MGRADYWKSGSWLTICDICGQKFHSSDLKERWDGLMCCSQDWNPRQPQDFVRGIPDPQAVPWSRPDVPPPFVPNPVSLAITDFFGAFMIDFVNDIMVTLPGTVQSTSVFASVSKSVVGAELEIQDQQTVQYPFPPPSPTPLLNETFILNESELS
jgi:hypothetical protein